MKESEIAIKRNRGGRREKERDFHVVEQGKNVECYE